MGRDWLRGAAGRFYSPHRHRDNNSYGDTRKRNSKLCTSAYQGHCNGLVCRPDANTFPDTYTRPYADAYGLACLGGNYILNTDARTQVHAYGLACPNAYVYPNCNTDHYTHTGTHAYADRDSNSHSHPYSYSYAYPRSDA